MAELVWDQTGQRLYETGVDKGVLYIPVGGVYESGYAWNGLTAVTESPTGAEASAMYADNMKYLNLLSVEEMEGTIEAYTYPAEFAQCDGTATPEVGVSVAQQTRRTFGLSYRTKLGNDVLADDYGYKLHLIYGALATPSEKAFATINDSPEAITFSWSFTTSPVSVTGLKPTALLTIDSTLVDAGALATLEDFLYGTAGTDPSLPLPDAVIALFSGSLTLATPVEPAFNSGTETITIPTTTGVTYRRNGVALAAGALVITEDTIITATADTGYYFPPVVDTDWFYDYTP